MAEVVGLVASVVTLGEVAIKVIKLRALWNSVKDVPKVIQSQLDYLDTLPPIIAQVEADAAEVDGVLSTTGGASVLRVFKTAAAKLESVVQSLQNKLQSGSRLQRTAAKVKIALDQKSIVDAKEELDQTIQILHLAITTYSCDQAKRIPERTASLILAQQAQQIPNKTTTGECKTTLSSEKHSRTSVAIEPAIKPLQWLSGSVVGDVTASKYCQSVRNLDDEVEEVRIMQVRIRFPSWLSQTVWDIIAQRSVHGMTWKISGWNVRDGYSPVFRAAGQGSIHTIKTLISSGDASLFDRDEVGWTLLHHAVWCGRFDTATSLVKMGHPVQEEDLNGWLPCPGMLLGREYTNDPALVDCVDIILKTGDFYHDIANLFGPYPCRTPINFSELLWNVPGVLELFDRETSRKFSQRPLSSRFSSFRWGSVNPDVVWGIITNTHMTVRDMQLVFGFSFQHSFHAFVLKYIYEYASSELFDSMGSRRRELPSYFERWQHLARWMLSGMSLDSFAKIDGRMRMHTGPLVYAIQTNMIQGILGLSQTCLKANLLEGLRCFVNDALEAGVDVVEFGRKESSFLQASPSIQFDRLSNSPRHAPKESYLVSIRYGPTPGDWDLVWDELVEEFAGEFWEMIGNQLPHIPGAWVDED